MALESAGRSGLGFYVRSLLEARSEAGEQVGPTPKPEPPAVPDVIVYCAAATMGRNRCETFALCNNTILCPEAGSPTELWEGFCEYLLEWSSQENLDNTVLPEHFPITAREEDGSLIYVYPEWQCLSAYQTLNVEPDPFTAINNPDNVRSFSAETIGVPLRLVQTMRLCAEFAKTTFPPTGTQRISLEMPTVRFGIVSVDAATDRFFLGPHSIDGPYRCQVNNQPQNNGYYDIVDSDTVAGWVQVDPPLTQEPGGGVLTILPGVFTKCGDYSAITDICDQSRVTVGASHGIEIGDEFRFTISLNYGTVDRYTVIDVGADYVDIDEPFFGDEAGKWAAGHRRDFYTPTARVNGAFTAVTAPAGVFPAICTYAGDGLSDALPSDLELELSNMGAYNGRHPVSLVSPNEFRIGGTQRYVGDAAGDWINYAVQLVTAEEVGDPNSPIRVIGTLGTYDGEYATYTVGTGPILPLTWYEGTDSGTVQEAGLTFDVDGLPPGYDQTVSVRITGTTSYDGTYNNVSALEFFGIVQILFGGDLDQVYFTGAETGSYEILSPDSISGNVLDTSGSDPVPFSAVVPEKTGTVTKVESEYSRVAVGANTLRAADTLVFYGNAVYTDCDGYAILTVEPTSVDVVARFAGTDAGEYRSDQP